MLEPCTIDSPVGKLNGCWGVPDGEAKGYVFCLPGDGVRGINGYYWGYVQPQLAAAGYGSLVLDYPGFGKSEGSREYFTYGTVRVLIETALAEIKKRTGAGVTHLLANSAGASFLLAFWHLFPASVRAAFMDSPAIFYPEGIERAVYKENFQRWIDGDASAYKGLNPKIYTESFEYNYYMIAKNIRCPLYILHGTEDEFIDIEQARRFVYLNPDYITLSEREGVGHYSGDEEVQILTSDIISFFDKH